MIQFKHQDFPWDLDFSCNQVCHCCPWLAPGPQLDLIILLCATTLLPSSTDHAGHVSWGWLRQGWYEEVPTFLLLGHHTEQSLTPHSTAFFSLLCFSSSRRQGRWSHEHRSSERQSGEHRCSAHQARLECCCLVLNESASSYEMKAPKTVWKGQIVMPDSWECSLRNHQHPL